MVDSWYQKWFDTPYYHTLYENRNFNEAKLFIDSFLTYLRIDPNAKILDLACGKGRHSIYLNSKGFDVTGIDLSKKNITALQNLNSDTLYFLRKDMREIVGLNSFDLVLNLFTSFGYFESHHDNQLVINNIYKNLKPGGLTVIDFMNTNLIVPKLPVKESKLKGDIKFDIHKFFENGMIKKLISFNHDGEKFEFEEQVQAYELSDFKKFILHSGLELKHVFGDYQLNPFDPSSSERLVIVCRKNEL